MSVFEYSGIDSKGKKSGGIIDAENERAARMKLRRMGIFPTQLAPEGAKQQKVSLGMNVDVGKYFQRVKIQEVAAMTRQLSALLAANIPLVDALTALVDQIENVKLRSVLSQVREKVIEGGKLSEAMKAYPKIFSEIYVNMVNAGENSGALDLVMQRLADFTEGQAKLRSKIMGAMMYPIIMGVVGFSLVTLLLTIVVPKMTAVFADMGATLPLPTRILLGISNTLVSFWWLFALLVGFFIYFLRRYVRTPKGKEKWHRMKLKLPIFGNLNRMVAISRFSRTLSTLIGSGVPLLGALDIVRNIVNNVILQKVIEETHNNVREGQGVAETLKKSGEFPPLVTHMIGIGEKTGELEPMLERVADTYDGEVDTTLGAMTSLLEPVMILIMAAVVVFIVLSILLPMLKMNQLA